MARFEDIDDCCGLPEPENRDYALSWSLPMHEDTVTVWHEDSDYTARVRFDVDRGEPASADLVDPPVPTAVDIREVLVDDGIHAEYLLPLDEIENLEAIRERLAEKYDERHRDPE